jgi:hypothetical protein
MSDSFSKLQLRSAFSYPFEGEGWVGKLALYLLAILSAFFIPILPYIILTGYARLIMEKVILENGNPCLPAWNDLGLLMNKGWKVFVTMVLYSLPAMLVTLAGMGAIYIPLVMFYLPQNIETAPSSLGVSFTPAFLANIGAILSFSSTEAIEMLSVVAVIVGILLMGLGMILGVVGGMARSVAIGHLIAKDKLSAAFEFGELWKVFRANWSGYVLAYLVQVGCGIIMSIGIQIFYFTMILCCLVPFISLAGSMYISLISYALYARAYQQAQVTLLPNKTQTVDS